MAAPLQVVVGAVIPLFATARRAPKALIERSSKWSLRIAKPAGLGAFAITVSPPPATAPATSEYLYSSDTPSTSEPR